MLPHPSLRIRCSVIRHSPKGPAVKQLGNWIATLESAIQQTSGAKLELVKVGEWAKGQMGLVMERS